MPGTLRIMLRFAALLLTLALVATIFGPSDRASSPYLSALSDLAGEDAFAAHRCPRTACDSASGTCIVGQFTCKRKGTGCVTTLCNK